MSSLNMFPIEILNSPVSFKNPLVVTLAQPLSLIVPPHLSMKPKPFPPFDLVCEPNPSRIRPESTSKCPPQNSKLYSKRRKQSSLACANGQPNLRKKQGFGGVVGRLIKLIGLRGWTKLWRAGVPPPAPPRGQWLLLLCQLLARAPLVGLLHLVEH